MKTLILSVIFAVATVATVFGQTYVHGYYRSNGAYVQPHYRSTPNSTNIDNWSTRGNINPYTGSIGSVARDYSVGALNYGAGHTINVGSRGGEYYINDNYNKVYVPKQPEYSVPVYSTPSLPTYSLPSLPTYSLPSLPSYSLPSLPTLRYPGF
jgi:hypothetical protein